MFQIRMENDTSWPCDAGGITLEYYRGRPLGRLIAAVQLDDDAAPLQAIDIGAGGVIEFGNSGRLLLRINESPTGLHDNLGQLQVQVQGVSD